MVLGRKICKIVILSDIYTTKNYSRNSFYEKVCRVVSLTTWHDKNYLGNYSWEIIFDQPFSDKNHFLEMILGTFVLG